jgi:hypothetical protein
MSPATSVKKDTQPSRRTTTGRLFEEEGAASGARETMRVWRVSQALPFDAGSFEP